MIKKIIGISRHLLQGMISIAGGAVSAIARFVAIPRSRNSRRVIVFATAGIGDVIQLLPGLRGFAEYLKTTEPRRSRLIVVVGSTPAAQILRANGFADETVVVKRDRLVRPIANRAERRRVAQLLRSYHCDTAVIANPCEDIVLAYLARLSGAKRRVGYRYPSGFCRRSGFMLTEVLERPDRVPVWRLNEHLLSTVARARIDCSPRIMNIPREKLLTADKLLEQVSQDSPLIAIHMGSGSRQTFKRWPTENFRRVAEVLHQEQDATIVVIGGRDECDIARQLCDSLPFPVINTVGKLSILQTAAVLSRCDFMITNDSGPMHLASAVDTPVVAVFGPTDPERNPPMKIGAVHRIVRTELPCSPCHVFGTSDKSFHCTDAKVHRRCLTGLTPELVLLHARSILASDLSELEVTECLRTVS